MSTTLTRQQRNGESSEEEREALQASLLLRRARLPVAPSLGSARAQEMRAEVRAAATHAVARANELLAATLHTLAESQRPRSRLGRVEGKAVEALREQRVLARLAEVLASTLDYESTLTQLIELIAEDVGDVAVLYVCSADGVAHRVRVAHRDPSTAWYCDQIQDLRGDASPEHPVSRAIATRRPLFLGAAASVLSSLAHSQAHARALAALDLRSVMAMPLVIADRCVGALLLKSVSRVYGSRDLRFAGEVAHRAALLIENATLHQTAQQAIQARDEMLAVVAHDLRNPLSSILLEASMLAIAGDNGRVNVRDGAMAIQDAVKFMKRMTEDLLDAERIRSGRLSVNRSRVAVAPAIWEFARVQKPILAAGCLELRVEICEGVGDVDVDHDRLLQVLENLVGNAERFTPYDGRITIGAKQCDGEVLFWISDTGVGVEATELPRLFDRFVVKRRIDRRGIGLGLPIVRGIVEAHGGRVWAESTVGEGSTFFFTLPVAIPQ